MPNILHLLGEEAPCAYKVMQNTDDLLMVVATRVGALHAHNNVQV